MPFRRGPAGPGIPRTARVGTVALGLLLFASCARQGAPAGGQQDRVPPVVVSVKPEPFATVEPGLEELEIRFNERISEQAAVGGLNAAVTISPEIADLRVNHDRRGLNVEIPYGLQPGITYAIRVRPVIRDMFGNAMVAPFEWVVSTGGSLEPNAVVGQVWDRLTGEYLPDIRVELIPDSAAPGPADTLRYVALSGDEGVYALRYLPPGPFSVRAFQDRNGDRILDPTEPVGRETGRIGEADTLFLSVPILLPDTSAAVLSRVLPVDSLVIRATFTDALDPAVSLAEAGFTLAPDSGAVVPDSVEIPEVTARYHEFRWRVVRDSLVARADSLFRLRIDEARAANDSLRADSLQEAGREVVPGGQDSGPPSGGGSGGARRLPGDRLPDGSPPPSNTVVLVLSDPLPAGIPLRLRVTGVVNLNGLPDGGGEASFTWSPPVDSLAADSLAADSLSADSIAADTLSGGPGR